MLSADIKKVEAEMLSNIKKVEAEMLSNIKKIEAEMFSNIKKIEAEMFSNIKKVEAEMVSNIKKVETEMVSNIKKVETEMISNIKSTDEADVAGVATFTEQPTATGYRAFGMEPCSLVERKKRPEAEMLSMNANIEAGSSLLPAMKKQREAESLSRSASEADTAAVSEKPISTSSGFCGTQQLRARIYSNYQASIFRSELRTTLTTTFNGLSFYNAYKDAEFLKFSVKSLLARGHDLIRKVRALEPGHTTTIERLYLDRNTPLVIKRAGENTKLEDSEFTFCRLFGLAAAYAYENRKKFPNILSREAKVLGLVWDQSDEDKCILYLSALIGAAFFIDQFSFCPLLCGIRNYQLKEFDEELVVLMGGIKNASGQTMADVLSINLVTAERFWLMFPGTSPGDLLTLIKSSPELKKLVNI